MANHTNFANPARDEKLMRRKRFLKRMEAKLRLKEAMQDHDVVSHRQPRFQ